MAKYDTIREAIKGVFDENITPEQAEKLGRINAIIDEAEKKDNEFIAKHEELRTKYINAIKDSSFAGEPKATEQQDEPKSLEYFLHQEELKAKQK